MEKMRKRERVGRKKRPGVPTPLAGVIKAGRDEGRAPNLGVVIPKLRGVFLRPMSGSFLVFSFCYAF